MKSPSINDSVANLGELMARRPDFVMDDELWAAFTMLMRANHENNRRPRCGRCAAKQKAARPASATEQAA